MLNPKNSYKAYSKTDVNTSDQLTLIIMLYDGLLRFLKKAMVKIEENDVRLRTIILSAVKTLSMNCSPRFMQKRGRYRK